MQDSRPVMDLTISDLKRLIKEALKEIVLEEQWGRRLSRELKQRPIFEWIKAEFDPDRVASHEELRARLASKGSENWAQDIIKEREERI